MHDALIRLLFAAGVLMLVFVYSLCRMARWADDQSNAAAERRNREKARALLLANKQ